MFKKISDIEDNVALYRDDKTGVAVVRDGSTGIEYCAHPRIPKDGSVAGMKRIGYWTKDAKAVRAGKYIYNISKTYVCGYYDELAHACCHCEACRSKQV